MILITTTRRPSRRTRSFVRDLFHVIPNAVRRNRGKMSLEDVNQLALELGLKRIMIVGTSKGNPSSISFYEASPSGIKPISIIFLQGVSLRRELTNKRAPSSKSLCISYSSPDLSHIAQLMVESFGESEPFFVQELGDLKVLYPEYDVSIHLSPYEGLILSSFYRIKPLMELGPRMKIRGFRELAEGINEYRDRVRKRERS